MNTTPLLKVHTIEEDGRECVSSVRSTQGHTSMRWISDMRVVSKIFGYLRKHELLLFAHALLSSRANPTVAAFVAKCCMLRLFAFDITVPAHP